MKKIILGVGLLICSVLGEFTRSLLFLLHFRMLPIWGVHVSLSRTLSDFVIVFFVFGMILSIWGFIDKDKNDMKKVAFGTGLLICGILRVFTTNILEAFSFVFAVWSSHHGSPHELSFPASLLASIEFAYALIIVGVAFNIWGLIKKGKRKIPLV